MSSDSDSTGGFLAAEIGALEKAEGWRHNDVDDDDDPDADADADDAEASTPEGSLASVKVSHGASAPKLTAKQKPTASQKRQAKKYADRKKKRAEEAQEPQNSAFALAFP